MAKRKRSRGLGGTATSPASLKAQAKACGSHYFDPSTMRFFNSRLLAVYPVAGKPVTYFVEAKGGAKRGGFQTIPRHYAVGVFKGCRVSGIGKQGAGSGKGAYATAAKAKKVAKAIAEKASGYAGPLKRKPRKRR